MGRSQRWITRRGAGGVVGSVVLVTGLLAGSGTVGATDAAPSPDPVCSGGSCTVTFTETGAPVAWVVPAGVMSISATLYGANGGGGSGGSSGGSGAEVTAAVMVSAEETLTVNVGGAGGAATDGEEGHSGYGGGGGGSIGGGVGGGASLLAGGSPSSLLVLAGGGGGGGAGIRNAAGGAGGSADTGGTAGQPYGELSGGGGGRAGDDPSDPGAGGTTAPAGGGCSPYSGAGTGGAGGSASGSAGTGGSGGFVYGGGGGGGYIGGGGGGGGEFSESCDVSGGGGGGGGSSYASGPGVMYGSVDDNPLPPAGLSGNGEVVLSFQQPTAQAPAAPTDVTATSTGATSASVSFDPPAYDGGSPVEYYTVIATDQTHPSDPGIASSGYTSPVTVTGLTDGDAYNFSVTATNYAGQTGPAGTTSTPTTIGGTTTTTTTTTAPTTTTTTVPTTPPTTAPPTTTPPTTTPPTTAPAPVQPTVTAGSRSGPGPVTLTGTATPNSTVAVYGQPYGATRSQLVATTTATNKGTWTLQQTIGRSTYFSVTADGLHSKATRARIYDTVTETLTSPAAKTVTVAVATSPAVAGVSATVQLLGRHGIIDDLGPAALTRADGTVTVTLPAPPGYDRIQVTVTGGDGSYGGVSAAHTVHIRR